MKSFGIYFLSSNIYIAIFIIMISIIKKLLKKHLTNRIQYNIWFILLVLLIVPFLKIPFNNFDDISKNNVIFSNVNSFQNNIINHSKSIVNNDFAISINSNLSTTLNDFLILIWLIGVIIMFILVIHSFYNLQKIKKSSLPIQNQEVKQIYKTCLFDMKIKKELAIYSTVFLDSPILTGILHPSIYIPIQFIADSNKENIRYMLLHELNHYLYKDNHINYLTTIARIIYWFNPFVRYALKEMRIEREIACDTSTLMLLPEKEHILYGRTLVNLAEKISQSSFLFSNGMNSNRKQTKRRVVNIVNFKKETLCKKVKGIVICFFILALSLNFVPLLSVYGNDADKYIYPKNEMNISNIDYSNIFGKYDGSFVLYDSSNDIWKIYNQDLASLRVSPHSTYKIYDALLALENNIISPENSTLNWTLEDYPFEEWEQDHDLKSAMNNSVNWYFQTIDTNVGFESIHSYLKKIEYGNQITSKDINLYWTDLSLKISPIEQVELLTKLYNNSFGFAPENINAVKNAIFLSNSDAGILYGKTGTGRVDEQDVNGWFVGYIETVDNTYFFSTNIGADSGATGGNATEITMSILSDLNIWK